MLLLHIDRNHDSSWSLRPWLMMKMAGIEFAVCEHDFLDDVLEQRRQWRSFSPTSKIPVLEDGAVRVWDSLAICLYLAERHPRLWPDAAPARAWAYAAVAEMHAGFAVLRSRCPFPLQEPVITMDDGLAAEVARLDELWQQGLQAFGGDFLAGSRFTLADAFYAPVVLRLQHYGLADGMSAAAQGYMARIQDLAALREWRARPANAVPSI